RTLPTHALGRGDQSVAVGVAVGFLQGFIDQMRAVITAGRVNVRIAVKLFVVGFDEFVVQRRVVIVVVIRHRDYSKRSVAHALERGFKRERVLAQPFGLGRINAALSKRLADGARLRAARNPDVDRVGVYVLGALDEGGE